MHAFVEPARFVRVLANPIHAPRVRRLVSFGLIGVVSTLAYVLLYLLLRPFVSAASANLVSLAVTAVGNTAANRRFTFAVRGRAGLGRDHAAGLVSFGLAWLLTTGALWGLSGLAPRAGTVIEVLVLVGANVLATLARFVLLSLALGRPRELPVGASPAPLPVLAVRPRRSS
jgi:putative flippase GtrA